MMDSHCRGVMRHSQRVCCFDRAVIMRCFDNGCTEIVSTRCIVMRG